MYLYIIENRKMIQKPWARRLFKNDMTLQLNMRLHPTCMQAYYELVYLNIEIYVNIVGIKFMTNSFAARATQARRRKRYRSLEQG